MRHPLKTYSWPLLFVFIIPTCISCKDQQKTGSVASDPADMQTKVHTLISDVTDHEFKNASALLQDSNFILQQPALVQFLYKNKSAEPLWSSRQEWKAEADSLYHFIESSQLYGLFPEDYHFARLFEIRKKFMADSASTSDRKNVLLWTSADLLLTDAFVQVLKDIKLGRLPQDSISLRKDSVLPEIFFLEQLDALQKKPLGQVVASLEPAHRGYHLLKEGIKKFLDSADYKTFTHVPYPGKDKQKFISALQQRLYEGGFISFNQPIADSLSLAKAIKSFQLKKGITADGVAGEGTVRMLNVNDREKFIRIAISLDKYKMLPEKMPAKYIWVNTSSNTLELVDQDDVKFRSKVICGKPKTRTPLLTSQISEIITYPQWVPPPSIVSREILPAVKRNPGYLSRRGFHLVDSKGNTIDPYSVNWAKYKTTVPYRIVQGSGDANALGIMKFVFNNKYSVYLHDTNQRYLFNNTNRSLSHGCVRVQDWEKLTYYILRNDSVSAAGTRSYTPTDSLRNWLREKQKKSIAVRNKIPLYIRYFTCEGENGNIRFYDDVYSEDKLLREKYFSSK